MPDTLQSWEDPDGMGKVHFHGFLVSALNNSLPSEKLPLVVFFGAIEWIDEHKDLVRQCQMVAAYPFVLAVPQSPGGLSWFLQNDEQPSGGLLCTYQRQTVQCFSKWIVDLTRRPGIDLTRLWLFGFSEGRYAVLELLALGWLRLSGVGLGASWIQPDWMQCMYADWAQFLKRLGIHGGAQYIHAIHSPADTTWPWNYSKKMVEVMNQRQVELNLPPVKVTWGNPIESDDNYDQAGFMSKALLETLIRLDLAPPAAPRAASSATGG